jgi:hypothetical protein
MDKLAAANSDGNRVFSLPKVDSSTGEKEMGESGASSLTTEKVYTACTSLLDEMGFRNLSIERSEDFTGRIDGVFTREAGIGKTGNSGYLRLLTVYRSGEKIHIELYNFLKKFPADNMEMSELKKAFEQLFGKNRQVRVNVHE